MVPGENAAEDGGMTHLMICRGNHGWKLEGQDTETVMRLYGLSRDNLYQIRTRLTEKLREMMPQVLAEMDAPCAPGPRP